MMAITKNKITGVLFKKSNAQRPTETAFKAESQ